jgi:hypothetical protein
MAIFLTNFGKLRGHKRSYRKANEIYVKNYYFFAGLDCSYV